MRLHRTLSCLALVVLALLSACGGGGGGGAGGNPGGSGNGPVTPPPVTASGLVPDAPAVGATLYADASTLRVLRDGAVWTYRGIDQPRGPASTASETVAYANTVTQRVTGIGTFEDGSNPFNSGADTLGPLRLENGAYKYTQQITLVEGAPAQAVDVIELRSPVRVNDQYVSLDKHIADSGADLDGDKVNDAIDVAMYTRVVGEELLGLPNRSNVKTVRVDTTMRARVTYSKNGAVSPVVELLQSIWYAPGVGIVKTRGELPNATAGLPNRVLTEVLQNWDGVTEGLGHTATLAAAAPAASPLAGAALQYPLDAAGFDTHAVVATTIPGKTIGEGVVLAQLDNRGKVLAARSYTLADLFPGAHWFGAVRLLRVGSELRLLARTDDSNLSMAAFDSTGQSILRPAVTVLADPQLDMDTDGTSYRLAADASGIWIGWVRLVPASPSVFLRSLALQHFDTSGHALGTPRVLLDPVAAGTSDLRLALSDARLAVSWKQTAVTSTRHMVLIDTASGATVADKDLGSDADAGTHVETLALQPGIAMASWIYPVGPVGAARLDANGDPVLSAGATLATDTLAAPWLARLNGIPVFGGFGGQLLVSAPQYARYWPEDVLESGFTSVFLTTAASGPLATSEPMLLARIPGGQSTVLVTLKLGNRLLLVGHDSAGYLDSTVVWLPN